MLEIGWGKLVIIGIVALLVIGPKELPTVLRTFGQWMTKLRRMASEFQSQFQEAMREAEMADLKKQVDEMTSQAQSYANFDPIGDVRREFEGTQRQIESAIAGGPPAGSSSPAAETAGSSAAVSDSGDSAAAPSEKASSPPPASDASVSTGEGAPARSVDREAGEKSA